MVPSALEVSRALRDATAPLTRPLPSAPYVANALVHAWAPHAAFVGRYAPAGHRVRALWLGMNPGPWGMAQTGVPFGAVHRVRDFLGIDGEVVDPGTTHPKRPIEGFACVRREVSGDRLWGLVAEDAGTPDAFFAHTWVANYCPLIWQSPSGANVPPDKLPSAEVGALFDACDAQLRALVDALQPETVIGVGAWAEGRARAALAGREVRIGRLLHPSPASPAANRGWAEAARAALDAMGHPVAGRGCSSDDPRRSTRG